MNKTVSLILNESEALAIYDAILLLVTTTRNQEWLLLKTKIMINNSLSRGHYTNNVLSTLNEKILQIADVFGPESKLQPFTSQNEIPK